MHTSTAFICSGGELEKRITDRFCAEVIAEAAVRYGVESEALKKLGGFESYIFKYQRNNIGYVLRISHSIRRSMELIRGEVDWIRYLASNGVPVADAVPSASGNLVEIIPDGHGGSFLATAFNEVMGKTPWEYGWTPGVFHRYGSLMGRMHQITKAYKPSSPGIMRPLWDSQELHDSVLKNIPADQTAVIKRSGEVLAEVRCLSADCDSFGLIHFDAHGGNLLIDETGTIHLFDFDDCCRSWFINDIAIVLFYMVTNAQNPQSIAGEFLLPFLKGYSSENKLDPVWLDKIPLFLKLREIDLYAVIHRSFDVNSLSGWCGQFMEGRRDRIEKGIPYLNYDFSRLAGLLA